MDERINKKVEERVNERMGKWMHGDMNEQTH
jgi:hypothetical protein